MKAIILLLKKRNILPLARFVENPTKEALVFILRNVLKTKNES